MFHRKRKGADNDVPGNKMMKESLSEMCDDSTKDAEEEGIVVTEPYYLNNFVKIVTCALEDTFYDFMFSPEDRDIFEKFKLLSENSKKLYVRLFLRKHRWILLNRMKYEDINNNELRPHLQELVNGNLLSDQSQLDDLQTLLATLTAPQLRTLSKGLRISPSQKQGELVQAIMKLAKGKSAFGISIADRIMKDGRALLSDCYRLQQGALQLWGRCFLLARMAQLKYNHDMHDQPGQQQIFQMLLADVGQAKYPDYKITRKIQVFPTFERFESFCRLYQLERDVLDRIERRDYTGASAKCREADVETSFFDPSADQPDWREFDSQLPNFLRFFSPNAVLCRLLSASVELLQKHRDYAGAVTLLRRLLGQHTYGRSRRGLWYERLTLNLDQHLKKHSEALDECELGLLDPYVRTGRRLAVFQRAEKICKSRKGCESEWKRFEGDRYSRVQSPMKVYVSAETLSHSIPNQFNIFIGDASGDGDFTVFKRVEDVALAHYRKNGYPEGKHGEGGAISHLMALFLWNEIFADASDVFVSPFQPAPLDFHDDEFFETRKLPIEARLAELGGLSPQEFEAQLAESWAEHEDVLAVGTHWQLYDDFQQAKGLVTCIGSLFLLQIFRRMIADPKNTRGGFPDLIVWNCRENDFRIVEVKGPNDRLSTKQILWMDFLCKLGIKTEVCHISAIGSKMILS